MSALLAFVMLVAAAGPAPVPAPAPVHNFHVSYGRMAVQGHSATLQLRFFHDDLEAALKGATGNQQFRVEATPSADAAFLDYVNAHLVVTVAGRSVPARILASGEENDMWWYRLQYDAPVALGAFSIRNTLLFEAFEDQRNIFKVMHFPGEQVETLYFTQGAEAFSVRF